MFFTTVQLRSADEGSTVFFRCVCGYKYVARLTNIARLSRGLTLLQENTEQLSKGGGLYKHGMGLYFGCKTERAEYQHYDVTTFFIPFRYPSGCRHRSGIAIWYQRIFNLAALFELCHVEGDNHTVSHYLLRIIQELFQGILNSLLITQTA